MRERWEALTAWQHLAIVFPPAAVLTFLANLGPFNQPLWRSIIYGIIEGGLVAGLVALATAQEKARRGGGDQGHL